jgi:hypothetical protein
VGTELAKVLEGLEDVGAAAAAATSCSSEGARLREDAGDLAERLQACT